MFTYIFHYSWISQNFLELFHFPKITRKRSGFPRIREISFKVETLISAKLEFDFIQILAKQISTVIWRDLKTCEHK